MAELLITVSYITLFAILAGIIASKFKQPSVIILLLIGSIVGPNALGIIKDIELIRGAADLGAILLLFLIGIEFSISKMLSTGVRALIITVIKIAVVFFFGYEAGLILGFNEIIALYFGIMLSISSTAIFIKVIEDKSIIKSNDVPLLINILILEDIFAIFALTFFSTLKDTSLFTVSIMLKKFAVSLIIISLSYLVLMKVFKRALQWLIKNTTEDTFTFIAIGTCVGFSLLAAIVNLSPSVGAFLAGSLVATFSEAKKFQETMHSFSLTFVALFFLSLGMLVDFKAVIASFFLIFILLFVNLISKFFSISAGTFFVSKFNRRQAISAGLVFTSVGEFSLLIAKEGASLAKSIDLISITATVIFFSAIIMSLLIRYSDRIDELINSRVSNTLRSRLNYFASRISRVPAAFEQGGVLHSRLTGKTRNALIGFFIIMIELGVIFILWELLKEYITNIIGNSILQVVIITFLIIIMMFPLSLFFRNIKEVLDLLVNSFVEVEFYQQIDTKITRRIGNYFIYGGTFILVGFLLPFVFSLISLPKIFNALSFLFIGIGILFIWGGMRKVRRRVGVVVKRMKGIWKR